MSTIYLVGLPATGKTTVSAPLAQALEVGVVDTDQLIVDATGLDAASFLRLNGEAAFRQVELDALRSTLESGAVVATGAGIVSTPEARSLLTGECVLWLDAPDETLVARAQGGDRPLLGSDHAAALVALRAQRSAWYEEVASAVLRADQDIDAIVTDAIAALENHVSI
jgi:shikimate kinase